MVQTKPSIVDYPLSDRILRPAEICERGSFSRTTLYRLIKSESFPPLKRIGANSVGLPESDFMQWLHSRNAAYGAAP